MGRVAGTPRILIRLAAVLSLGWLQACVSEAGVVPTALPDIRVTPAPTQNVPATATAFARLVIPTPTPPGLYVVKPGDTLSKIADDFATTVDEIMALNNLSDPNMLMVGQELTIPSLVGVGTAEATPEDSPAGDPVPTFPADAPAEPSPDATSVP